MMTERVDPRRAQVAQVGVQKRSLKRPWFLVIRCDKGGMHIRQSAVACISANQRPALSPP